MASSSKAAQNQILPENAFDQLAPSFAIASASANKLPYDVFINHRGCDVKHTLATTFYATFVRMGLRVFLDVEALEPGDVIPAELQHAITSASLHIAIFSLNYAQSSWCLAELSFMLKTGIKIIPIFYKVEPSDLRWIDQGTGIYAATFSEHDKKGRYTPEKLDQWRKALNIISFYSGYIVNEDEGRLLKNIVNCVFRSLKKVPLDVAKHPVGLDELVKDFEVTTLKSSQSHQNVKIVGIVGMGGSGKSTLSKELFNRNFAYFDRRSFVFDVRAEKNALHNKQIKLLEDFGITHSSFDNVEEGKGILSDRLRSVCALIVLDDVDHIDQLDALLPNLNNLASNSLVIVTSRELGVLLSWGISCNYHMPQMNRSHALQLFCWHAFMGPSSSPEFESLVDMFLMACNGLPLSLKVLGAQLYGKKSKEYWLSQLNKISRILPADIKQRLQVSYDALDKEEKEIFLDVACFFIGEEKSLAIAVWDGSGWSGLHSLETLVNKCLVELDRCNCIKMHDHLRDMGREIAATHSPYRLMFTEEILNIQKNFQERKLIRGIANFEPSKKHILQRKGNSRRSKRLRSSLGLKILHVKSDDFTEELASLSEDLVWLRCSSFKERNIPWWLSLRNISVLELYDAYRLEELWEDNVQPPWQLRELRIGGFHNVFQKFPSSIGRLKHLKKIILENGFRGSSLPEEFCGLQSLEHLALPWSVMLSSLPARFGDLTNLCHINLTGCRRMEVLPDSFKQLIHLEYLDLSSCTMLSALPACFGDLINLQHLNLSSSKQLTLLPNSFKELIRLEHLDLSYCKMLSFLPAGFGDLINLKHLNPICCKRLSMLPDSFNQLIRLEDLDLSGCDMLSSLPAGSGDLINLRRISLSCCKQLTALPDSFKHLIHLQYLNLGYCEKLKLRLDLLENIVKLEELDLHGCYELEELPHQITNQASLRKLYINSNLRYVPTDIGRLSKLEDLRIESWQLTSLPTSLGNLPCLTALAIACPLLRSLPTSLRNLSSLTTLEITGCEKLECLSFGAGSTFSSAALYETTGKQVSKKSTSEECCPSLQTLILCGNYDLGNDAFQGHKLMEIEMLPTSVNHLVIQNWSMVKNIRGISGLVNLQKLLISDCPELDGLPSFANLISLKEFEIENCPKVEKIEGLEQCRSLEELRAETSWEAAGIQSLQNVERLNALKLRCDTISALKPCIQSMKECPWEMIISGRAVHFVKPIVNSFEFPDLAVMQFENYSHVEEITEQATLWYEEEGEWIHIAVFRQRKWWHAKSYFEGRHDTYPSFIDMKGMVVAGEEEKVVNAFYQLLTVLE